MKVFIETCFGFRTFPLLKLLNLSLTVNAGVFDPKLNNEHALLWKHHGQNNNTSLPNHKPERNMRR